MDLVFKHSRDHAVSYGGEVGTKAALNRNKSLLSETDLFNFFVDNVGIRAGDWPSLVTELKTYDRVSFAKIISEDLIFTHLAGKVNKV